MSIQPPLAAATAAVFFFSLSPSPVSPKQKKRPQRQRPHHDFRKSNRPDAWVQDQEGGNGNAGSKPLPNDLQQSNEAFELYYRSQKVVPEAEFPEFLAALRRPLPLTFRVNGTGPFALDLRAELEAGFDAAGFGGGKQLVIEGGGGGGGDDTKSRGRGKSGAGGAAAAAAAGEGGGSGSSSNTISTVIEPPKPLPWYPDRLAWQLSTSRDALRRSKPLAALHAALVQEHEGGRVTRQEAVSMVPPLLLAPEPHHLVLDACASPGSKTAQLIEAVGGGAYGGGRGADPKGAVVANDRDARRCNMLCHQVKRLASPALLVTCHDAATFPVPGPRGCSVRSPEALLFDRVLADVPCSGDGTLRKAADLWRRWSPNLGNGLHPLQLRIALRCAALTRVGGRLVYSTCSLNPVEDEAVVAALLLRAGGALRLVDARGMLPGLETARGLEEWRVPAKYDGKKGPGGVVPADGLRLFGSMEEAAEAAPHGRAARGLRATMFPPARSQEGADAAWAASEDQRKRAARAAKEFAAAKIAARAAAAKKKQREELGAGGGEGGKEEEEGEGAAAAAPAAAAAADADAAAAAAAAAPATAAAATSPPPHPSDLPAAPAPPRPRAVDEATGAELSAYPLNLPYCIRVLPHANDTGGFFIALLEKVAHLPESGGPGGEKQGRRRGAEEGGGGAEDDAVAGRKRRAEGEPGDDDGDDADEEEEDEEDAADAVGDDGGDGGGEERAARAGASPAAAAAADPSAMAASTPGQRPWGGADPVVEVSSAPGGVGAEAVGAICAYYGLSPQAGPISRLFARLVEGVSTPKRLFTCSEGVRALLRADRDGRLKVTAAGVKTFERQDKQKGERQQQQQQPANAEAGADAATDVVPPQQCPFRVTHDGLALLAPLLRKQVVRPTALEMLALLEGRAVALAEEARVGLSEKEEREGKREEGHDGEREEGHERKEGGEAPPQHKHASLWKDAETISEVSACAIGGCVVCLRASDASALGLGRSGTGGGGAAAAEGDAAALATACWRGRASVTVHVTRNESSAYARRLRAALESKGVAIPTPAPPAPTQQKTGSGRDNKPPAAAEAAATTAATTTAAATTATATEEPNKEEEAAVAAAE